MLCSLWPLYHSHITGITRQESFDYICQFATEIKINAEPNNADSDYDKQDNAFVLAWKVSTGDAFCFLSRQSFPCVHELAFTLSDQLKDYANVEPSEQLLRRPLP